ncbi:MAG TPA: hypothetical protein GXX77_00015 [Candidatus Cloacimonetes bacterium]|nr:hypothetical protein [Candidatus Cloacimonadota bacterium]
MGVMLDVVGGMIIGGTLLLMVMTFQLQLQENAMRLYYTGSMISHMDDVAETINHVFSMVGIGYGKEQVETKPDEIVCVVANENTIKFRTYWDYEKDELSEEPHTVEIVLNEAEDGWGRVMNIIQDGEIIFPMGHILFIEDMKLGYYDKDDAITTDRTDIMSAEVLLTFRRESPWKPDQPLRSNLQLKCYFMNRYLQHGA